MIEDPDSLLLYRQETYKCWLISEAATQRDKDNPNSFLSLTMTTHQFVSQWNLVTKRRRIPSLAISFEQFGDFETFQDEKGQSLLKQKVIIGIESRDARLLQSLGMALKPGSYPVREGKWHTFVHVDDAQQFRCFVELKYGETMAMWERGERAAAPEHGVEIHFCRSDSDHSWDETGEEEGGKGGELVRT